MKIEILEVHGIDAALYGLGLSYGAISDMSYVNFSTEADYGIQSLIEAKRLNKRMQNRATKNAHLGLGHNKYLESIMVWIKVTANRFIWSELDTYRLMTKQSDSTMHTLLEEDDVTNRLKLSTKLGDESILSLEQRDELISIVFDLEKMYDDYEHILNRVRESSLPDSFKIQIAKHGLPEAWQQTRVLCVSYKTLQNIYAQRKNHRLHQWKQFCEELKQLPNSEWITKE